MDLQIKSIDDHIIDRLLEREGSEFTDDPLDRGGATKYGITQRSWNTYLSRILPVIELPVHVRDLTEPQARDFYRVMYVEPCAWIDEPTLRELVIDTAVHCGAKRAVSWLQYAALCRDIDGIVGPETRRMVNTAYAQKLAATHRHLIDLRENHYIDLCVRNPSQLRFLKGWMSRLREFRL